MPFRYLFKVCHSVSRLRAWNFHSMGITQCSIRTLLLKVTSDTGSERAVIRHAPDARTRAATRPWRPSERNTCSVFCSVVHWTTASRAPVHPTRSLRHTLYGAGCAYVCESSIASCVSHFMPTLLYLLNSPKSEGERAEPMCVVLNWYTGISAATLSVF